jgi:hypothetical protein
METLKVDEHNKLEFSPGFIDEGSLRRLLALRPGPLPVRRAARIARRLRGLAVSEVMPGERAVYLVSPSEGVDDAFRKALDFLEADDELGARVRPARAELERSAKEHFKSGGAMSVRSETARTNRRSLVVERVERNDRVSYLINGKRVLRYRRTELGIEVAVSAEVILAWIVLFWDALSFIGVVLDIAFPRFAGRVQTAFTTYVEMISDNISRWAEKMKLVESATAAKAKIHALVEAFKQVTAAQVKGALKAVFSAMGWRQRAIAILEFLAALALFFVSAGVSLIAKMIRAVAHLILVIADIERIRKLKVKWS